MTDSERGAELTRLMDAYGTDIKRFCTLQLKDRTQAEDAAQDAFVKAWRALDSFRGECGEKTWLMRIAVNTCRDYQRTGWFRFMDRRITPDDLQERAQECEMPDGTVSKAIAGIPDRLRMAVILRYYEGLTIKQTASALHVSESTAKRLIRKANALMRLKLEGWYTDE